MLIVVFMLANAALRIPPLLASQDHAWVSYNTSKSAVLQMGRSMACELGPKRIRVNTLSPGHIYTKYVRLGLSYPLRFCCGLRALV